MTAFHPFQTFPEGLERPLAASFHVDDDFRMKKYAPALLWLVIGVFGALSFWWSGERAMAVVGIFPIALAGLIALSASEQE